MNDIWRNRDAVFRARWRNEPLEEAIEAARTFLPKYWSGVSEDDFVGYAESVVSGGSYRF